MDDPYKGSYLARPALHPYAKNGWEVFPCGGLFTEEQAKAVAELLNRSGGTPDRK